MRTGASVSVRARHMLARDDEQERGSISRGRLLRLAEQASEQAGPAHLVLVHLERRSAKTGRPPTLLALTRTRPHTSFEYGPCFLSDLSLADHSTTSGIDMVRITSARTGTVVHFFGSGGFRAVPFRAEAYAKLGVTVADAFMSC